MKDSVTVYSNVALLAAAETSSNKYQLDLSSKSWESLNLEATVTNSTSTPVSGRTVTIYYAFSDQSFSATDAPNILDKSKKALSLILNSTASSIRKFNSEPVQILGDYLYFWVNHGSLGNPVSLDLIVTEVSLSGSGGAEGNLSYSEDSVSTYVGTVSTEATATVSASATVVTLMALNTSRKGLTITNNADKDLYVKLGSGASTSSFKVKVPPGAYYELPGPIYTGVVTGIWSAGPTGNAMVCESY